MPIKDWIGVATGITALVLSGATAYFNVFRQSDDLRVVISGTIKSISLTGQNRPSLNVDAEYQIAFINAGTQAIDISQVGLVSSNREKEPGDENDCPAGSYDLGYKLDGFVLKPGEIIRKNLRFSDDATPSHGVIPLPLPLPAEQRFLVCLRFDFVTLDAVSFGKSKAVMRITVLKDAGTVKWDPLWSRTEPLVLLNRWHTIFSR